MKMIYEIINNINDKKYIGQSKNADIRFKRHLYQLKNNKHHSCYFQKFYNKYSNEIILTLNILYINLDEKTANTKEESLINTNYGNLFNVSKKSSGGDLISYHPNKKDIIKRMVETQKLQRELGLINTKSYSSKGIKNPNYSHGNYVLVKLICPLCQKERTGFKIKENTYCRSCSFKSRVRDISGKNNPFYR